MKSPKLRVLAREKKITGEPLRTQPPAIPSRPYGGLTAAYGRLKPHCGNPSHRLGPSETGGPRRHVVFGRGREPGWGSDSPRPCSLALRTATGSDRTPDLRPWREWGSFAHQMPQLKAVIEEQMSRKHELRGFWNPSQSPKAAQSPKEKSRFERKRKPKRGDGFYRSREWLELRYLAFKHYGRRCMCCGAGPHECQLQVDHIKPRIRYPEFALELTNLQILCRKCNSGKSWKDTTDWRDSPLTEEQAAHLRDI